MNRLNAENTADRLFSDPYGSARKNTGVDSSDLFKAEKSLGINRSYDKSDLIHMGVNHNLVFGRFFTFLEHNKIAEWVNAVFGIIFDFFNYIFTNGVFSAGYSRQGAQFFNHFKH